ncbi:MAG: dihydrolipoyl dehydrogenase [Candidatus Eremiobacteraeota bacterium]|nr:dihydrolipoyl dehydrogenase [Candidatus Eremiobacteraeota bacterium]
MKKRLAVLGGGPGGYAAALTAAQKGMEVTLIEERQVGGTCLNRGCIPTKALLACSELYSKIREAGKYGIKVEKPTADLPAMMARKDKVVATLRTGVEGLLKKRGVTLVPSKGTLAGSRAIETGGTTVEADSIILATGTEALRLFSGENIITSDEALCLNEIPETLLVIGAGAVGLEMACFFAELGSRVTVVEMLPRILPGLDAELTDTLARELKKKGLQIKTGCPVEKIEGASVSFSDGTKASYSKILQAVGRKFNTGGIGLEKAGVATEKGRVKINEYLETSVEGIYAIGDIVEGSTLLAHAATAQGITAALCAAGEKEPFSGRAIPNCIYTHPEVASVGMAEGSLENPLVGKIPYRVMGKAHASGELAGLIKIVADRGTRKVMGVHIVGEKATELIHEGILAVMEGISIRRMAEVIRAHPTFAEIYSEAFHLLEGRPIHSQ